MPELPDLEVIREFLQSRLSGVEITSARLHRPVVVRNLLGGDLAAHLVGRRFASVSRRGKFLILTVTGLPPGSVARAFEPVCPPGMALFLVINPMLAGRLRYGSPLARDRARDAVVLGLAGGQELRYHDARDMGKVYLTSDLGQVPAFAGQGPEATDPGLTLELFRERLRRHTGEIKGVLTDQGFVAGIGNAYADEICWRAGLYPMRRRASLGPDEVARLYRAMREVLAEAIEVLRVRVGDAIDVEVRDFLAVHGRAGEPCPRCGSPISEVTRQKRSTHFCRTCQPGLMVARREKKLGQP